MPPEEPVTKSILDKPLSELTEDDISQLTREDCRRYLKEKGMRRPSWNKSQAIQQVISLKALLEPPSVSGAASTRRKLYIPRPQILPSLVPRETSADTEISVSADELIHSPLKDPDFKPDRSGDLQDVFVAADTESLPPRTTGAANVRVEQMTIFYCGKVNVYDDVPADKAQAIMQFAASPLQYPLETQYAGTTAFQSHLQAASVKVSSDSSLALLPTSQTAEGQGSRKASVQRYLEKRKDRFRSKRKVGTSSCASLDMYLNHQIGNQAPTRSFSLESIAVKNANFSADLKD